MVKEFVLALSMLGVMMSGAFPFHDDFQSYNYVTDASFIGNYSLLFSSQASIASAPSDSLAVKFHFYGIGQNILLVNQNQIYLTPDSSVSVLLRKGSLGTYDHSLNFFIFTNTSDAGDLYGSRGYVINYDLQTNTTELRRCAMEMYNPTSCGVVLNSTSIDTAADGWSFDGTLFNLTADLNFTIITDSGYIEFFANGVEEMLYADGVYTDGGFGFGALGSTYNWDAYWDELISGAGGAPNASSGWSLFSFPTNQADWIGIGSPSVQTFIIQHALYGTSYVAGFFSMDMFDGGYPTNRHLEPYFVMLKNGAYLSPALWSLDHVRIEMILSSPHASTCYYNENSTSVRDMHTASLYTTLGATSTYIYNPSIAGQGNQSYLPTNPWVVGFLKSEYQNQSQNDLYFYCVTPENLTAQIRIMNASFSGLEFIHDYDLPIGYRFFPNGTIDYGSWIDANDSDSYIIRHHHLEETTTPGLVDILFSDEMIGLGVIAVCALIGFGMLGGIGAFAASIVGMYVVVRYALLPDWLFVIVIVAVAALGANALRELITGH
jgi:hypothetical protein